MTASDVVDMIASRLRHAAARVAQAQAAALKPHGVTPAEWVLMQALYDGGAVAPSALARACGLTRGAVTKLVDRLRAKRLVVRAGAGREDRRYQTIALTGAGATLVPVLSRASEGAEESIFEPLTPNSRIALLDALCLIR